MPEPTADEIEAKEEEYKKNKSEYYKRRNEVKTEEAREVCYKRTPFMIRT